MEKRKQLVSKSEFAFSIIRSIFYSAIMISVSLGIGVVGYHYFAHLSWIDSLLNASMILTGMGPVDPMHSDEGKLFASFYSLFSGIAFLTTIAVFLSPILHRFMAKLHLEYTQ